MARVISIQARTLQSAPAISPGLRAASGRAGMAPSTTAGRLSHANATN
jgi:hypothetical protein